MQKNPMVNINLVRKNGLEDSNSSRNVHDKYKSCSIEELQEISNSDRLPWHTLALNLTGDLNVGTIIRTSHCLGAKSVIIFGRNKIDKRSAVGSANYIKVEKVGGFDIQDFEYNPDHFVSVLKERKLVPIFVECGGEEYVNWKDAISPMLYFGFEPCLIMGNETGGIPKEILDTRFQFQYSFIASIPQRGVIRSLNVAVAHAIISSKLVDAI